MSSEGLSMTSGAIYMRGLRKRPGFNKEYSDWWKSYVSTERGWLTKTIIKLRDKSRKIGLDFNLTKEDLEVPSFCPVLGIELSLDRETSNDNKPSVDRIDNLKGYIKGNIRVISGRANRIKSDASLKEIEQIYHYMKNGLQ